MKLNLMMYVTLFGALVLQAGAQEGRSDRLKGELDQEVSRLYDQSGGREMDRQDQIRVESIQAPSNMERSPVVVMDSSAGSYVEKRPTTYIEAAPLEESKATRMRKQRESMEVETEMRIVEKLESDRMESERERAARIFGDKWDRNQQEAQEQRAQAPVQPQIVVVQPQQNNNEEKQLEKEDFKQDLRSIVNELKTVEKEEDIVETDPLPQYYFMVNAGAGEYPGASNVKGVYSFGMTFGMDFFTGMMVEAGLGISSYDLDPTNCGNCGYGYGNLIEVRQTNISLALKHKFASASRFSPIIGALSSLSIRDYESAFGSNYPASGSKALDLGILLGADVTLSNSWAVGADLKYMFNLTNRIDRSNNSYASYSYGGTQLEKMQYYIFSVNTRFMF